MVIDGIYYALALSAGGAAVWYFSRPAFGVPLFLLAAFCLYFFTILNAPFPTEPWPFPPPTEK